jgi:hypothetical protein
VSHILNPILKWVTALIVASFTSMFAAMKKLLVATPDVTILPQVQLITGRAVTVLDIVFVLAFTAAGALTIVAGASEQMRYTAKDLMPRMVFAFIAAHFSPLLVAKLIQLVNATASTLVQDDPRGLGAFTAIRKQLTDGPHGVAPLLFVVLAAVITFLFAAVSFTFIVRLGVLIILAVVAPLALACHSLPQLDGCARLWWRSLIGCLAVPVLQALTLQSGESILLDPRAMKQLFHMDGGAVLNMFVVISLLFMTAKIPGLVRRYVTRSGGNGLGAMLFRVVVVQQGVRALTSGIGGKAGGRAGGAAGAKKATTAGAR